VITKTGRKSHL